MPPLTKADKELLSRLHNATPEFLVDELGELRAEMKKLAKKEGIVKEALKGRLPEGANSCEGEEYICSITQSTRVTFSKEIAKGYLTAEQFESCLQEGDPFLTIRTTKKDE